MQNNRKLIIHHFRKQSSSLVRASCDINDTLQNHHILNSVGLLRVEFDGINNQSPSYGTAVILKTESRYPYILTAAHHVVQWNSHKQVFIKPSKIWFELRANNQSWKFWDLSRMTRKFMINPQHIRVHPKYLKQAITSTECDSDIAVIKCSHLHTTPQEESMSTVEKLRHVHDTIQQLRKNKKMGCELLIADAKHKRISIVGFPVEQKGQMYASNGKVNQTQSCTMFSYNVSTLSGQDGSPIFLQQIFKKTDKGNPYKSLASIIGIHVKNNRGVKMTQEKYDWIHKMLRQLGSEDEIFDKISFIEYPKKSRRYTLSFNNMFWTIDEKIVLENLLKDSQPTQKGLRHIMIEQEYHSYIAAFKKLSKKCNSRNKKSKSMSMLHTIEQKMNCNMHQTKQLNDMKQKLSNEQKQCLPTKYQKVKLKQTSTTISNALVVLICIEEYSDDKIKNVTGATMNKQCMIDLFYYKYNYDIIYNEMKSCTQSELDNIIRIAQNEFGKYENNYDCVICIFCGHAAGKQLICSDQYDKGKLLSEFDKAFDESNVPNKMASHKLFFIDACPKTDSDKAKTKTSIGSYQSDANTIIFYPNVKGNESYSGGVLIHALSNTMFDENRNYSKSLNEIESIMKLKMENDITDDENGNVIINTPFKQTNNVYFKRNDIPKSQRAFRLSHPELTYKCSNVVFK